MDTLLPLHELFVEVKNLEMLKQNFIPFLKNGGLFIPKDNHSYILGEELNIKLSFSDEHDILEFIARVVWLPAKEITDTFTRGIGVEFCDTDFAKKITNFMTQRN